MNSKGQMAVFDLIAAINDAWLDVDKVVSLIQTSSDKYISFDDFYDCMHQFGFDKKANIKTAYNFIAPCISEMPTATNMKKMFHEASVELMKYKAQQAEDKAKDHTEEKKYDMFCALVAHNNMKPAMTNFVVQHLSFFKRCKLVTTASTGRTLKSLGLEVDHMVSSGPLGGDQEIGGMISKGEVAAVFFFIDPLSAHPHADDIAALMRICAVHNVIAANNPSTGHAMVFALQSTAYGLSMLKGLNPNIAKDSDVVKVYKEEQKLIIDKVSVGHDKKAKKPTNTKRKNYSFKIGFSIHHMFALANAYYQ